MPGANILKLMRKIATRTLPSRARSLFASILPESLVRWFKESTVDCYLISYPKCGRTWLALLVGRAVQQHYNLPDEQNLLELGTLAATKHKIPLIRVSHDDNPHRKPIHQISEDKEKYRRTKVIFLVRDPRDVLVSSYFQDRYRDGVYDGSLSEYMHRETAGFKSILRFYNIWAENRLVPSGFLLVRYEDLQKDPTKELGRVLRFVGLPTVSDEVIAEAVEFASFENMRKMEISNRFDSHRLRPGSSSDARSLKTRRGKVGGFVDYLGEDEVVRLNEKMKQELSPFYGY